MKVRTGILCAVIVLAAGCAGKVDYVRPTASTEVKNTRIFDKPKEQLWNAAVPAISKQFFVINNLDKSSGLINVSYAGDPEKYVDCGKVSSYVKNARGERTYNFPAASRAQTYEVMEDGTLFYVSRKMELEGRMNLVFEDIGNNKTRVTANTKYVLKREMSMRVPDGRTGRTADSISFNSGGGASFPSTNDGRATECVSTGTLENELLNTMM